MGIKHLWTVLGPHYERKPLYELQGKKVAVDLSCWVCEAQNIAEFQVQPRMYLRNLYFRSCFLLLMEVNPVFILEGKAPELKYETIAARNAIQFKGAKPKTDGVKTGKDRTRFHFTLKLCEEMLGYMGLACLKGKGEAESLCAYLNEDGLVDGCISQDSDCFAYGAKVVYRNFSISQQGSYAASGGAVDVYDINKANKTMNFGRNKIIAMALLLGSDYSDGVFGVGKEAAVKLFDRISDEETLDRLRSWRTNEKYYKDLEEQLADKNKCTSCGHSGKVQMHTKNGCLRCGTNKGCDSEQYKETRAFIKNELSMRSKALADLNFPNEALVQEFLVRKDTISSLNLKWKQPNVIKFVKFTSKYLEWEELYAFEKILPILTRWQILNYESINNQMSSLTNILVPESIKKVRNPKGIPSYEIIWSDPHKYFAGLIPESQLATTDLIKLYSTIEPQYLIDKTYPDLVETFKQSKIKPKKTSKRKKKVADDLSELLKNTSISEPVPKKQRKPRAAPKKKTPVDCELQKLECSFEEMKIAKTKPIESYFKKAVLNNYNINNSTPIKSSGKANISFDLDQSKFGDEDDLDVSDIVENIIKRKVPHLNLNLIGEESSEDDKNSSWFFTNNPVENDLFEKTFNQPDDEEENAASGDESTQEYNVEEILNLNEQNAAKSDSDDSFSEVYVPLIQRITKK